MRTTVTIDPDTEKLIRDEVKRSGRSFKQVLNEAVRGALTPRPSEPFSVEPLFEAPFPRAIAGENFNRLGDAWEDESTLAELRS